MIYLAFFGFVVSFFLLFKSADHFVDGATGIAGCLRIPKIVVGIVLVGLATTAPEFVVSVAAAFKHHPEIALGNAVGSVICDDGVALALAALLAPTAILVSRRILLRVGVFLLSIDLLAFFFARDGRLSRLEGMVLVALLLVYFVMLLKFRNHRVEPSDCVRESPAPVSDLSLKQQLKSPVFHFLIGLTGVVITGNIVVECSVYIAEFFSVPEIIIGSTVIALGTSLPEISTCITAARKGEGDLAVGNILGADVLNILWIIGVASLVQPIQVDRDVINFAFPFMILIVTVMLGSMWHRGRLGRAKGILLLGLYVVYIVLTLVFFI